MSIHMRNAKRDDAERAIVERLRQLGAQVTHLSGEGVPDLLVAWRGLTRLAEVKTGKATMTPQQRQARLTPAQIKFHAAWSGSPIPILTTADEATDWILSLRKAAAREAEASNHHHEATEELEDS